MRDFIFLNRYGLGAVTLRTEAQTNTPAIVEPIEIKDGDGNIVDSVVLEDKVFQRLPYGLQELVIFAQDNLYSLIVSDSNGGGQEYLHQVVGGGI